jgi:hypothetical protein
MCKVFAALAVVAVLAVGVGSYVGSTDTIANKLQIVAGT